MDFHFYTMDRFDRIDRSRNAQGPFPASQYGSRPRARSDLPRSDAPAPSQIPGAAPTR
jgi:hypothetical protein